LLRFAAIPTAAIAVAAAAAVSARALHVYTRAIAAGDAAGDHILLR
jgi:hypothetical protein